MHGRSLARPKWVQTGGQAAAVHLRTRTAAHLVASGAPSSRQLLTAVWCLWGRGVRQTGAAVSCGLTSSDGTKERRHEKAAAEAAAGRRLCGGGAREAAGLHRCCIACEFRPNKATACKYRAPGKKPCNKPCRSGRSPACTHCSHFLNANWRRGGARGSRGLRQQAQLRLAGRWALGRAVGWMRSMK